MMLEEKCSIENYRRRMITGALKAQTQDDNRGPWVTNNSAVVSYWPPKECSLESCVKQFRSNEKSKEQASDTCKTYRT